MRFSAFVMAMIYAGSMSVASAGTGKQSYVVARVEADLIITKSNDRIALYGVRLVQEAQNAALYRKAQQYMQEALGTSSFTLDSQAFRDLGMTENRYDDLLGRILLSDGGWLQEQLIARGYGIWSGAPGYPSELRERLVRAERGAALEKLGIWRKLQIINANQPGRQYWDGQFIVARGVVRDVFRGASATYLNFGEDWRKDFTVAIPARSRKKFRLGDWTIADLKNRSITVRGLVRFYNGPYLELDFPEQLEINNVIDED